MCDLLFPYVGIMMAHFKVFNASLPEVPVNVEGLNVLGTRMGSVHCFKLLPIQCKFRLGVSDRSNSLVIESSFHNIKWKTLQV